MFCMQGSEKPHVRLLVPLLPLLLVSCGGHHPLDTHPTLIIDSSFTPAEMTQVTAAILAWESVDSNVHFTVQIGSHDDIGQRGATSPADDTIYFQRLTADGCEADLATWAGITQWTENYSTISCVNADELDSESDVRPLGLQACVAHELGHSLGLWHIDEGVPSHPVSIMTTYHQDEPANALPTCLDVNDVAQVHHLAGVPCP